MDENQNNKIKTFESDWCETSKENILYSIGDKAHNLRNFPLSINSGPRDLSHKSYVIPKTIRSQIAAK